MARKSLSPKATNEDRVEARESDDTLAHRDVFNRQQLDRSQIEGKLTRTSRTVASLVLGLVVMLLAWVVASFIGVVIASFNAGSIDTSAPTKYYEIAQVDGSSVFHCFQILGPDGEPFEGAPCYDSEQLAQQNPPAWWTEMRENGGGEAASSSMQIAEGGLPAQLVNFDPWKMLIVFLIGFSVFGIAYTALMRNLDAQNLMNDTTDINQYDGDQQIALPYEIVRKFDFFPNAGAHSNVQVSSLISHVAIQQKGLKRVEVSRRAEREILDEDGDVEYLKGEILRDDDDRALTVSEPIIDGAFMEDLFEVSGVEDKKLRRRFDTTKIPYNPGGRDYLKQGEYATVADLINHDWTLPEYEVQRPGGAYVVDTAPVNTMVLAITRAGKGQTYIEPVIDMWLREKRPGNMVINDPKGELLKKNYVSATLRGFQIVQFNLMNSMKTDIYNPLGLAAEAAREGDSVKCAQYVENIANVFFPLEGAEDPVWPNAANNAFKRAAYGLIDYYLEEERELRAHAARTKMDPKVLETRLDSLWGKVTLFNCYQLFVQLTSKKMKNPMKVLENRAKAGEFGDPKGDDFNIDAYDAERKVAQSKEFLWEDKDELDLLTLFFNSTSGLPRNKMRGLVADADNALRAMGAAEKMLASVYGIAITAMSFFTDPTISTLTSGTPSQNTDLGGLSFPRRMGVRFATNYLKRDHLVGAQARWRAYSDPMFTNDLGEDFEHEDIVSREGWARYYFKGIFPSETSFLRLQLVNAQTGMLIREHYFRFTKDFQTSLNGRYFIKDPITSEKIIKNGLLVELVPLIDKNATSRAQALLDQEHAVHLRDDAAHVAAGGISKRRGKPIAESVIAGYQPGHSTYPQVKLTNLSSEVPTKEMGRSNTIISTMVRYSEKPKAVFLVTPPHLMKYAKLILILIKQLVDLNFDQSYMTKNNQKPLYKTRFMLDELGNLQSDGHGIAGFETMLSIGLGQDQQFTIILQTLQQLRDVYGESVDKIVQGNTSNIVFMKSTDDSMLETLSKMSGTRHVVRRDQKTVTKDTERLVKGLNVEGKVSYTMSAKEEAVITYNDLAFMKENNNVVYRAGDAPVWNRNETTMPASRRLLQNTIVDPRQSYTLQTIPTLSSAVEFDVRLNQPDFGKMLAKRMLQAESAVLCKTIYQEAHGYKEVDINRLDPDLVSEEIMELVDVAMREVVAEESGEEADEVDLSDAYEGFYENDWEDDMEMAAGVAEAEQAHKLHTQMRYAEGRLNRDMIVNVDGSPLSGSLDDVLIETYRSIMSFMERDTDHFSVGAQSALLSADGRHVYISRMDESDSVRQLNEAMKDASTRVFAEEDVKALQGFRVMPEFYRFLGGLEHWRDIAGGEFERTVAKVMREAEQDPDQS